jgi:hypothetical protein
VVLLRGLAICSKLVLLTQPTRPRPGSTHAWWSAGLTNVAPHTWSNKRRPTYLVKQTSPHIPGQTNVAPHTWSNKRHPLFLPETSHTSASFVALWQCGTAAPRHHGATGIRSTHLRVPVRGNLTRSPAVCCKIEQRWHSAGPAIRKSFASVAPLVDAIKSHGDCAGLAVRGDGKVRRPPDCRWQTLASSNVPDRAPTSKEPMRQR